jgi:thioesterase domain-containing protein/acyl carrier protein
LAIAKHFAPVPEAKLVLLGRSAFPAESAWESWLSAHTDRDPTSQSIAQLRALQQLGAEVLVVQADVSNMEDMRAAIETAKQRFGKISGVVHAAGVLEDGVMQMRTSEAVERVFTPKVHGTVVLRDLLKQEDLKFFMLCSSTSAALGPAGQVDYVAANAFMNAFAEAEASNSKLPITALNWGIWSDIGMAHELAARMFGKAPIAGERHCVDSPWFFERIHVSSTERMWRMDLVASDCWLLEEHRLQNGLAVMPGAAYLELALTALFDWQGERPTTLEDVQFLEPCEVPDDAPRELCIGLKRTASGFDFEARSRPRDGQQAWRLHAQGRIARGTPAAVDVIDLNVLQERAQERFAEVQEGSLPDPQDRYLVFGPRFKTHKSLGFDGLTACARLSLAPKFASDFEQHKMHAALLDIGTGCAMDLIPDYNPEESMFVPLRYGRLEYHAPLTADLYAQTTLRLGSGKAQEVASFDVELCNASGKVLVSVRDFQLRRLQHSNRFATASAQAAGAARNTDSPAERAFLEALKAGIDEASGMEALDRVLSHQTPAVLTVSSMDMAQLQAKQSSAMAHMEDTPNVTFQRPNLSSDYVEPEDAIEEKLAAWWQEFLGIEQVGVMDDFFEVGGHSLIAVRLFARIKKEWDLDYPLSVLFEAPTIRLCADILRKEMAVSTQGESGESAGSDSARSPYLVPLNVVPNSPKTPFFLVAGMFGNVLNLRHLCAHLGADQPVYAIQARGLHGDDRPHRRFEDMARDYLVEIRKLQPNGPYLLGGFSGGGLTAFEMAQQLDGVGEKTETLILLDTPITKPPVANSWERILIQAMKLRRGGVGYVAEWPKKRIAWEFEKRRRNQSAQEKDLAPAEFRSELIREGFVEALQSYEIRPYPGRLTIFRPPLDRTFVLPGGRLADQYREIQNHHNHWDPFTPGGIDCFEVPGDHDSMVLEPHVRVLGAKVCQVLQTAQDRLMQQGE